MDPQPPFEAARLFSRPFQWEAYARCREALRSLAPEAAERFSVSAVSYGLARRFLWIVPISARHVLINFDFPFEVSDPLLRAQALPHAGRYIHQMDVRDMAQLEQAIEKGWLSLALACGRGGKGGAMGQGDGG